MSDIELKAEEEVEHLLTDDMVEWSRKQADFVCNTWNVGYFYGADGDIHGVDRDDYYQAASVGLVESAHLFKDEGYDFKTYAFLRVRGEVFKEVVSQWNIGSLSGGIDNVHYRIVFTHLPRLLREAEGKFDSVELANQLTDIGSGTLASQPQKSITPQMVQDVYSYMGSHQSLDTPIEVEDGDDIITMGDMVESGDPTPEDLVTRKQLVEQMHEALQNISMDDIDREIVVSRMLANRPKTLKVLMKELGVPSSTLHDREQKIIEKLRIVMGVELDFDNKQLRIIEKQIDTVDRRISKSESNKHITVKCREARRVMLSDNKRDHFIDCGCRECRNLHNAYRQNLPHFIRKGASV
jgi:RNA polymerase sigma factor (sigma-70 family)